MDRCRLDEIQILVDPADRLPQWTRDCVALVVAASGVHVSRGATPLGRRGATRKILIGRRLFHSLATQSWHDAGFLAFLGRALSEDRSSLEPGKYPLDRSALERIAALANTMSREVRSREPGYRAAAVSLLVSILVLVYRSSDNHETPPQPIDELISYIQDHYTDPLSLEGLAERCAMSPSHLSHRFRQSTGKALFSYINEIRVDRACALLKRSSMSVLEVSLAVGYNSLSFFNRYFRRITGTSPSEYRRTHQS